MMRSPPSGASSRDFMLYALHEYAYHAASPLRLAAGKRPGRPSIQSPRLSKDLLSSRNSLTDLPCTSPAHDPSFASIRSIPKFHLNRVFIAILARPRKNSIERGGRAAGGGTDGCGGLVGASAFFPARFFGPSLMFEFSSPSPCSFLHFSACPPSARRCPCTALGCYPTVLQKSGTPQELRKK